MTAASPASAQGAVVAFFTEQPTDPGPLTTSPQRGLNVVGGQTEAVSLIVVVEGDRYVVADRRTSPNLNAGFGCTSVDAKRVECQQHDVRRVTVNLGDQPDSLILAEDELGDTSANLRGGNDFIVAHRGPGRDVVFAGDGDDQVLRASGGGANETHLGLGNDRLIQQERGLPGEGIETITGGPGNDAIEVLGERTTVSGDDGADRILFGCAPLIPCGSGHAIDGGAGSDTLSGTPGGDSIIGGSGNDLLRGVGGPDSLRGGDGVDRAELDLGGSKTVTLDDAPNDGELISVRGVTVSEGANFHADIEEIASFGESDDSLTGDADANHLFGGPGADKLVGGGGADTLRGFSGDDSLSGGPGDDNLDASLGANKIEGDSGNDFLFTRYGQFDPVIRCGLGTADRLEADLLDLRVLPTDCESGGIEAVNEGPLVRIASHALAGRGGTAVIRLKCPRSLPTPCAGTLAARVARRGADDGPARRYRIRPGRAAGVTVRLPASDRRRVNSRTRLRVTSLERGQHGAKTTVRTVRFASTGAGRR